MKRITVLTTKYATKFPEVDFEALKQKEIPMVMKWKEEGILENFFYQSRYKWRNACVQGY